MNKFLITASLVTLAGCAWTERQVDAVYKWGDENMPTYESKSEPSAGSEMRESAPSNVQFPAPSAKAGIPPLPGQGGATGSSPAKPANQPNPGVDQPKL